MATDEHLDVRGLSCPQPVMLLKNALGSHTVFPLTVLTDSKVAVENMKRLLQSMKLQCQVTEQHGGFIITVTKEV